MRKLAVVAQRAAQICAALAALIYLISGVAYLCLGHWMVTHQDFWGIYNFSFNHTWLESALLKHNSHSLFFPSFFWLTDLRFFHASQQPLFLAGLALLFITVALLLIPIWQDQTVDLTAKTMATLVVIMGNFWMARSPITASGGFNVICSLAIVGALVAVLFLPKAGLTAGNMWSATLIMICAGFVASFSFGTGLAIWPALFLLGWYLRLPWRFFASLSVATVTAIVIYDRLPPHSEHAQVIQAVGSAGLGLIVQLWRLVGSPFVYAASGWHEKPLSAEAAQSSLLSLWCGSLGLVIAVVAMSVAIIRRHLNKSSLKLMAMALVAFNIVGMALVAAGRADRFRELPFEVAAPRYLFWSTLFWTGLLLMAIECTKSKQWLRWPVYLVVLALPVLAFPQHYRHGLNARWARGAAEYAAVSLVNNVCDEQQVVTLGGYRKLIYRVAEELRIRRLDMFAEGLQDWIGLRQQDLFGGRQKRLKLEGRCSVAALVQCDNGAPAARVIGQATMKQDLARIVRWAITPVSWIVGQEIKGYATPRTLVIIDKTGVVCGIARSSPIGPFVNRVFYLGKAPTNNFSGYIRDYDPKTHYMVRSADGGVLSEEEIPVHHLVTGHQRP